VRLAAAVLLLSALGLGACDPVAPDEIERAGGFVAVSAGANHSCGLTEDGILFCWGSNEYGQLGTGTDVSTASAVAVGGEQRFMEVAAGTAHTCAIERGGRLWCWGHNTFGQLGNGTRVSEPRPAPVQFDLGFRSVAAGGAHTCGIAADGRMYCWGSTGYGQAGEIGSPDVLRPAAFATSIQFASVTAGGAHTCGIDTGGRAYCWGLNQQGQLGNRSTISQSQPAQVHGTQLFRSIAAGDTHTCGVSTDALAMCWGSNVHGEIGEGLLPNGDPSVPGTVRPYIVQGLTGARYIAAGQYLSCVSVVSGATFCWGRGTDGQLGTGAFTSHHVSQRVNAGNPTAVLGTREISAGSHHVCAATAALSIFCWGRGDSGQLGTGTLSASALPVRVTTPTVR
jgi:alpha-tubulin suppressor-like RCC1 family protein